MNRARIVLLTGMILVAAASRILPHPPNFSPIAALALFGGAQFADRRLALLVPLAAMLISDLVLGLHALMPVVYGCFALVVCLGFFLRRHRRPATIAGATAVASLLFFLATNLAVWLFSGMYPMTRAGLAGCFAAALPFLQNTILGDLFFATVLFGGMALAERRFPTLRPTRLPQPALRAHA